MIIEGDASDDFFFFFFFLRHVSADRHVRLGYHVVVLGYDQDGGAWWRNSRSTVINDDASDIFFYSRQYWSSSPVGSLRRIHPG